MTDVVIGSIREAKADTKGKLFQTVQSTGFMPAYKGKPSKKVTRSFLLYKEHVPEMASKLAIGDTVNFDGQSLPGGFTLKVARYQLVKKAVVTPLAIEIAAVKAQLAKLATSASVTAA